MRQFKPADLDPCVDLFIDVFSQKPWEDEWPSPTRANAYLSDILGTPGFRGFVVCDGAEIVGLCFGHIVRWWAGDEFFIDELCIGTKVQRTGLGTRLIKYVKRRLTREGVQFVVLLTEKDTLAERFYAKQGFDKSSRMIFMYGQLGGK